MSRGAPILGGAGLTYTSAPFTSPMDVAGPIGVTIRARSNRPQTEWIATLDKVAPDGSSQPLTQSFQHPARMTYNVWRYENGSHESEARGVC